jgi:altronate hydrolase
MGAYSQAADKMQVHLSMNPSPGNIKDGLITDAIKSNGCCKKRRQLAGG